MPEDFLDDARIVNDGDNAHRVLADRAAEGVHVPDPEDEVAPAFGGQFERRGRRDARAANHQLGRQGALADAAHFVGVPAVVTDHLGAFVGDVLGDGGQEVGGGEDLEVSVDFGIETGAVDDQVAGRLQRHLFDRERVAEDVLGEVLEVGLVFRRDALAGVEVEPAVFPGVKDLHPFHRQQLFFDQQVDDLGAEQFLQRFEGRLGQRKEGRTGFRREAGAWSGRLGWLGRGASEEEAIGHEGVDMGMEVQVFAEGMKGQDDAGDAIGAVQGGAEVLGQALVGQGAEPLEEVAMALEVRPQHSGHGQDVVPVGHGRQHGVDDKPGGR